MKIITEQDKWRHTLEVSFNDLKPEAQQIVLDFFDCKDATELEAEEWTEHGVLCLIVKQEDSRRKISNKK